jgi:plastocyanin
VAVVLALVAGGAGGTAHALAARRVYPARLLVYAQEWSLSPSRATLPAGRVIVQLWNRGMDPHDLRARRLVGGQMVGHTFAVHLTLPGKVSTATWTLSPGRYQLYCSLPGHMMAGMRVQITVRRPA